LNYAQVEVDEYQKQKYEVNLNGDLEIAGAFSGHRQARE